MDIQEEILNAAYDSSRKKIRTERRNAPWWDTSFRSIRSKVRALRRQYQKEEDQSFRKTKREKYRRELAVYKRKILVAKSNCYKKYISNVLNSGKYYDITKFVNKERRTVNCMIKNAQGELTSNRNEAIKTIIKYHFRTDEETNERIDYCISSNNYVPTNKIEIKAVIDSMARNKTPGIDMIPIEIYSEVYKKTWIYLLVCFISVLNMGFFPIAGKLQKLCFARNH